MSIITPVIVNAAGLHQLSVEELMALGLVLPFLMGISFYVLGGFVSGSWRWEGEMSALKCSLSAFLGTCLFEAICALGVFAIKALAPLL